MDAVRGAPSELRRQLRERQRVRLAVLVLACLLVLTALPLWFGIQAAGRDPVFSSLDELEVPGWAAVKPVDDISGSRWCLIDCRLRERTVRSERQPEETAKAYEKALGQAGWQPWKPALCPGQKVEGSYTCWRRDELTLDLWVRPPACAEETGVPLATTPGGEVTAPPAPSGCAGSQVSLKVRNAIDDDRTRPQPSTDPSLTGVDPDPAFTEDPPLGPTPTPS